MRAFFLFPVFLALFSCGEPTPPTTTFSGIVMTIPYAITVGEPLSLLQREMCRNLITATFENINQKFNKFNPDSEVSAINRLKEYEVMPISEEMYQFLTFIQYLVTLTEGKFDPTVEKLQSIWKKNLEMGQKPTAKEIQEASQSIGWQHLHFDKDSIYKDHSLTSLDFGGVAKGHCVDLLIQNLNRSGFGHVLVEWGGEIFCTGQHPSGRAWIVEIPYPGDLLKEPPIAKIALTNQGIATSGDYVQNWKLEDDHGITHYSHIIHPQHLTPLLVEKGRITSSTVVANNCALADALATALMLFDTPEESHVWAAKLKRKDPTLSFWLAVKN